MSLSRILLGAKLFLTPLDTVFLIELKVLRRQNMSQRHAFNGYIV